MPSLRTTLVHIAAILSATAACSSTTSSSSPTGGGPSDGGPTNSDGGIDSGPTACGGCNCPVPATGSGQATPEQACAISAGSAATGGGGLGSSPACDAFCASLPGNSGNGFYCVVDSTYQQAYNGAVDGGASVGGDAGADAGDDAGVCPAWSGTVTVECGYACLGRRTAGIADPDDGASPSLGAIFANRTYLEAVSVHAFARLERELAFHGAPRELRDAARSAQRDEARHTAMTARLARRFGAKARLPKRPAATAPRSLFEIARENAVEGCVRETYGAVVGLLEARQSTDAAVRRAAVRIADDECGHAELALRIAAWIESRLSESERAAVRRAAAEAVEDLRARGDARIVAQLEDQVWSRGVAA